MLRKLLLLMLPFGGIIHLSFSQDITLDPVTVTSSLVEKRASETGRNITTIQGEIIEKLPVYSIDDLLRYLPGIEVQARGPMGTQSDIVLRGGTFQQVLVILDGIKLNDPNTGHFNSYIPIAPSEIARIEVLKGASSAIYGSEAVGGVIHIITKTFSAKLSDNEPASKSVSGSLAAGAHGLLNLQGGANLKTDKTAFSAGIVSNNAHGEQQRGINGYFHNHTLSASAKFRLSEKTEVAFRSAADQRTFAAQNFYTTLAADTASEKVRSFWNHLQLIRYINKGKLSLDLSNKNLKDQYLFNPNAIENISYSRLSQVLLNWHQSYSPTLTIATGLHYQNKSIRSNDRGNHTMNHLAPYVTIHKQMGNLYVNPSIRLDLRESIGAEIVPQLNLAFRKDKWQLRSTIGKSIRDADFTERYNNYNKPLVTGGSIGNPSLHAEKSLSYEVGADWFFNSKIKLSTTVFQRHHSNMIDYIATQYADMPRKDNLIPTGSYALAKNIAEVKTSGAELDLQYREQIKENQLIWVAAGLQWLNSQSNSQELTFYLSSHARWIANTSINYQYKNFQLSINSVYKNREPRQADAIQVKLTREYFLLNTKAEYSIGKFGFFVQSDNLFNTQYSDLLGSVMPGRWISGGTKFRL